ncbi:hypothetical protein ACC705_31660, partial [Rhizobium ruizarguesonis]
MTTATHCVPRRMILGLSKPLSAHHPPGDRRLRWTFFPHSAARGSRRRDKPRERPVSGDEGVAPASFGGITIPSSPGRPICRPLMADGLLQT